VNLLSELQMDGLTEVFNIGTCRAASSLSEIVGDEVKLTVPRLQLVNSADLTLDTLSLGSARLGSVKQQFSGPFDAQAMLLFTEERALEIVHDMMGSQVSIEDIAEFEQEAMCELGNIVLNACLSAMADIFGVVMDSTLPQYTVDTSEAILQQILSDTDQPVMMVLHMNLSIEKRHTQGYLAFLLSTSSLQKLLAHIDRFISGI
jgi:chemotaxis protein CheC